MAEKKSLLSNQDALQLFGEAIATGAVVLAEKVAFVGEDGNQGHHLLFVQKQDNVLVDVFGRSVQGNIRRYVAWNVSSGAATTFKVGEPIKGYKLVITDTAPAPQLLADKFFDGNGAVREPLKPDNNFRMDDKGNPIYRTTDFVATNSGREDRKINDPQVMTPNQFEDWKANITKTAPSSVEGTKVNLQP